MKASVQSQNAQVEVESSTTVEKSYLGQILSNSLILLCYENELSIHTLNFVFEVLHFIPIFLQISIHSFLLVNEISLLQGSSSNYFRKVNLVQRCYWTTIFKKNEKECVLVLLYQSGDIELR